MSVEYRHKRYIRIRLVDNSLYTFKSTDDATTKISFKDSWNTNDPIVTYDLEDSDRTLVMTIEHHSEDKQVAWKAAIDAEWGINAWPWNGNNSEQTIEHFKTEWLHADGSVSSTKILL